MDGLLIGGVNVKLAKCTDGTSNTALVSEIRLVEDSKADDSRGRYYNPAHGGVMFTTLEPPNSMRGDELAWVSSKNDVSQAPIAEEAEGGPYFMTVRSFHPGGANVGRADGSVELVSESIDQSVFQASVVVIAEIRQVEGRASRPLRRWLARTRRMLDPDDRVSRQ